MKVFYNRLIPFGSYYAINLFGIVFVRKDKGRMSTVDMNHEYIHTLQQREMLYVPFYIWYLVEWGIGLIRYRNSSKAYRSIRFEREAYAHQSDLLYKDHRRLYSWLRD